MHPIDPYHFALAVPLLMACMALMCVCVWRQHRSHRELLWMASNQCLLTAAIVGQTTWRGEHAYISTLWVSALYFGAAWSLHAAMRLRLQLRPQHGAMLLIAMLAMGGMYIYVHQQPSLGARIAALSIGMAALLLYGSHQLLRPPARHALERVALVLYIATALCALLRPWLLWNGTTFVTPTSSHTLLWWGTLVCMLLLSLGMSISLAGSALLDTLHRLQRERDLDSLTGLLNRRALQEACGPIPYNRGIRTLVACDLDHFKRINDRYGHIVGDAVLCHFAQLLQRSVPEGALVARLGGEEFVLALPRSTLAQAHALAHRLAQSLYTVPVQPSRSPRPLGVSASFGVVQVRPGETLIQALERADQWLYSAKRAGRNCVHAEGHAPQRG